MFSFGFGEILIIGVVLLLFVGPDRLPQLMRTAGRAYGQLRRAADEMRRAFMMEADRVDAALRVEEWNSVVARLQNIAKLSRLPGRGRRTASLSRRG